ncbi:hypothetical protein NDU88_004642 [Pleurodeles waltl]|uniref:Uncharacterized protein n=1 Tax=Pleurodeles waltl TaxID=8319 RepID=A0AAV7QFU7_PLEWA|nr:hypothetical protein NDU88_004642 [Pleurodeles waltl]
MRPLGLRRGVASSPGAPRGSRGCRRPRETSKEESGAVPRGSVIGAPESGREPETQRTERPRLKSGSRRALHEGKRPGDREVGEIVPWGRGPGGCGETWRSDAAGPGGRGPQGRVLACPEALPDRHLEG